MKKILLSLLTISAVSMVVFAAARAYFSDTESNKGNTFSTGTIDISVDGNNPWTSSPYTLTDMKPSQRGLIDFVIQNVGTNPANIWKTLNITNRESVIMNQPKCLANGGTWTDGKCPDINPRVDIDSKIHYDLRVWVYDSNPKDNPDLQPIWHQTIYTDADGKMLSDVGSGNPIFLGMVPSGWWMKVEQSYHMDPETGNWAQGDSLTFDITLLAEQLKGLAVLMPKSGDPDWHILYGGANGTLTYGVKDGTFKYTFNATGLTASTAYSLIHYVDPYPGNGVGSVGLIGSGTTDGAGALTLTGDVEFHANMINAKVWLVPSSDYNSGTKSLTAWNPSTYLFETGLIDYYDSDL
jgi:hypothetical protein